MILISIYLSLSRLSLLFFLSYNSNLKGAFQIDVLHCHPDRSGGIENASMINNFDLAEKSTGLKYQQ